MESELNKKIETSTDKDILLIKSYVDKYIHQFELKYTLHERNLLIMKCYDLIIKKYLASPNAKFEANRESAIEIIVKSYISSLGLENLDKPK